MASCFVLKYHHSSFFLVAFMTLVQLRYGTIGPLCIRPRWPARQVCIDSLTLQKLLRVQVALPDRICLIVTRGYEPATAALGAARTVFRKLGVFVFSVLYCHRRKEIADIFGTNGHDIDGMHIDVSIQLEGCRIRLLPLGVFTPLWLQCRRRKKFAPILYAVQAELRREGFTLHRNRTERAQMHCDLRLPSDVASSGTR